MIISREPFRAHSFRSPPVASISHVFRFRRVLDPRTGQRWKKKFGVRTIMLQLGIDWFSKAKTGAKSILGIYARVLNLPVTALAKHRYLVSHIITSAIV